jgi:hypothetical protein
MATINYTVSENIPAGYTKVEWAGLAPGDDGQIFASAGLELASLQTFGSFSGTVRVDGSNEITPASFSEIYSTGGKDMIGLADRASFVGAVRPVFVGGGSGSASFALFFRH